jgi:hypothetical protein
MFLLRAALKFCVIFFTTTSLFPLASFGAEVEDTAKRKELAPFLFDLNQSPLSGAQIMIGLNQVAIGFENKLGVQVTENAWGQRALRLAFLAGIQFPVSELTTTIQHELFGHGARFREFGVPVDFFINWPPPAYGFGTSHARPTKTSSWLESAIISFAGTEATGLLARDLRKHFHANGRLDGRLGLNYITDILDLPLYSWKPYKNRPGHDIAGYYGKLSVVYSKTEEEAKLNRMSLLDDPAQNVFIKSEVPFLRKIVFVNLLDPFLFYSIYSIYEFLWNGESAEVFKIPFGPNVGYLPSARLALSPFGPEGHLENFFKIFDYDLYAYGRYGQFQDSRYYGFGIHSDVFRWKGLHIALKLDVWNQPEMRRESAGLWDKTGAAFSASKWGGLGLADVSYWFSEALSVRAEAGYKSDGYVPGEVLSSAPVVRLGFTAAF